MFRYAKWDFKPGVKINVDFENYNLNLPENTSVTSKDKSGGNKSLYFDCGEKGSTLPITINLEDDVMTVSNGQRFAISFDYKLNSAPIDNAYQLSLSMFTAKLGYVSPVQQKFKYNHTSQGSMRHWIRTTAEIDVWQQFSDTITIENSNNSNIMYFVLHQGNTMSGFIGYFMRLDYMCKLGMADKAISQCKDYFLHMASETLTLWENDKSSASCNHGFASYVVNILVQGLTGYVGFSEGTAYFYNNIINIDCRIEIPIDNEKIVVLVENGKRTIETTNKIKIGIL